ncbi:hypothetical protein GCM10017771_77430 [Streptomyces capitiformicae]|uniref:Uncharacterized protein n=1 Tax=Streptomyces capitiformicae TaxID=2014920 RepID=A0A919DJT0_9ACTN|nr:hypothetical protein GCM10017771_77430 [Streptomyces capitiformicae]
MQVAGARVDHIAARAKADKRAIHDCFRDKNKPFAGVLAVGSVWGAALSIWSAAALLVAGDVEHLGLRPVGRHRQRPLQVPAGQRCTGPHAEREGGSDRCGPPRTACVSPVLFAAGSRM